MVSSMQSPMVQSLSKQSLFWIFLRIGAAAFGDTGPVLVLLEREFIEKRAVLTPEDITEALTYTKLLPGSTVVQIVAYLGYKLGGWGGSALAAIAFVLPAALAMLILAAGYVAVTALPHVQPAITGLTAAVVGMLIATMYRLGKKNISSPVGIVIALAAFVTGAFLNVNAALIVIAAGLVGIPLFSKAKGGGK